jgi:fimbrial chaperone protein
MNSMHALLRRVASLVVVLVCSLGATQDVRAAGFEFSPLRVHLTARDRASLITLTNPNDTPVRLEVQASHWTQAIDGQPILDATDDLIVFPELLTIQPHEHSNLRVAIMAPASANEATYKVSIREIRSYSPAISSHLGVSIQMQADIPVFIAPTIERHGGALTDIIVQKRLLSFTVANVGTLHFVATDARVTGIGADARPLFFQDLDISDVLAGSKRRYQVDLSHQQCSALRALTIRVNAGDQPLIQTLDIPASACNS